MITMTESGIQLNTAGPEANPRLQGKGRQIWSFVFCFSLWGGILAMIAPPHPAFSLLAATVASATALYPLFFTDKKRIYVVGGVLLSLFVIMVFLIPPVREGVALLANELFDASAAEQRYVYTMFDVSASPDSLGVYVAILGVASFFSTIIGAIAKDHPAIAAILPLLGFAFFAAYFGILPNLLWLTGTLLAAVTLLATGSAFRHLAIVAAIPLIIAGCAFLFAPTEIASVSAVDDALRDRLAFTTATQQASATDATTVPEPEEEESTFASPLLVKIDKKMPLKWLILILIIIATLLTLFIPALIRDRLRKKNAAMRGAIGSRDNAEAIRATFLYCLCWLHAIGIDPGNAYFASIRPQLSEVLTPRLGHEYQKVVSLWREAAYSDHPLTDADRATTENFLQKTQSQIWAQTSRRQHLRFRFQYALWLDPVQKNKKSDAIKGL